MRDQGQIILYEMMVKVQHDCPFTELTKNTPGARFVHWCNLHSDILEVDCPDVQIFEAAQRNIGLMCKSQGTRIISKTLVDGRGQFVAKTCACNRINPSISELIEENNCMGVSPTVYTGGWEHHRVISFHDRDIRALLKSIDKVGTAQVVYKKKVREGSIRQHHTVTLNSLLGGLTGKQADAFFAALQNGYYSIPKQVTSGELARRHHVPRTTFEEHIRKAESKVLRGLIPFMAMYTGMPTNPLARSTE